jgi:hypothetical protein
MIRGFIGWLSPKSTDFGLAQIIAPQERMTFRFEEVRKFLVKLDGNELQFRQEET